MSSSLTIPFATSKRADRWYQEAMFLHLLMPMVHFVNLIHISSILQTFEYCLLRRRGVERTESGLLNPSRKRGQCVSWSCGREKNFLLHRSCIRLSNSPAYTIYRLFLASIDITLKRFQEASRICGYIPRQCFEAAVCFTMP